MLCADVICYTCMLGCMVNIRMYYYCEYVLHAHTYVRMYAICMYIYMHTYIPAYTVCMYVCACMHACWYWCTYFCTGRILFSVVVWVYPCSRTKVEPVTFEQHLSNQSKLLHGHEYYYHRSVPRIVTVLCSRMTSLYQHKKDDIVKELMEYCEGEGDCGEECTSPGGGGPVDIGRGLIEDLEEREDGYQRWGNSLQMEKEVNRLKVGVLNARISVNPVE